MITIVCMVMPLCPVALKSNAVKKNAFQRKSCVMLKTKSNNTLKNTPKPEVTNFFRKNAQKA